MRSWSDPVQVFGLALIALGAAIGKPVFILVDSCGIALIGFGLRFRNARTEAKS